ncbi:uncharacterized protein ASPGLDRAFT_1097499 [Aspergillus glaucus CBS 516.65]|uniref:Uncharacterized protein n=1 Tax=Aspergillus glaucus CBS 516.65 TaxID=1160497 RepID=A0A1L9V4U5_ASPGL|nr:hypothetical protein ASPGLDRAFT_1097499 [Aspergillus glaucus CBS 516.65]OJJ78852.1 hypothetical protein ASPGLDRAFT_1097499 [Aspergillus glaucus CBS 516.65]
MHLAFRPPPPRVPKSERSIEADSNSMPKTKKTEVTESTRPLTGSVLDRPGKKSLRQTILDSITSRSRG